MIRADEAREMILNSVGPLGVATISLERALGLVVAEQIISADDVPPFSNAAMDGYAVRSADVAHVPVILHVSGEIPAGSAPQAALRSGEAMRIMTGAKVPPDCDAVIQQEWVRDTGDGAVEILRTCSAGHNIRLPGSDIRRNQVVLEPGKILRPQDLGVLASLGRTFVRVYRPLAVAVLTTGAELIPPDRTPVGSKIRDSNGVVLSGLLHEMGCEVVKLGIARDDPADLAAKFREGLRSDALITSGGVSVGKFDLVPGVAKDLGVEPKFWKVNVKPGMPMFFGIRSGVPVFGLPGNPVSSMVTFLQFVRPALWKMMGRQSFRPLTVRARLEETIAKSDGKRHFIRGILRTDNAMPAVRPTGSQVSNVLTSLMKANCLIVVPEEVNTLPAGTEIEVELL